MSTSKASLNLKFDEIVPRMMTAIGARTQTELAEDLGVSPQSLSNFSKRGHVPLGLVVSFALKKGVPVEDFIKNNEMQQNEISPECGKQTGIEYPEDNNQSRIHERRKCLKLRKMVDAISKSEVTIEALPELLLSGLPNLTTMIVRQRYLNTHSLYF